jgi:hypothetical protein
MLGLVNATDALTDAYGTLPKGGDNSHKTAELSGK